MYTGTLDAVSNKAGYSFTSEIVDSDDDSGIDITGSEIVFEIRDAKSKCVVLSATTSNGKIEIVDSEGTFTVTFSASEMRTLCAATYEVGCTVALPDEEPQQLLIARLPVLDGVVS